MKGQLGNMLQQAQKLQETFQQAQREIEQLEITGEAGGGLVKVTINGKYAISRVRIDPQLMEDRDMLEDLIAAAGNDAVAKMRDLAQEKISRATGGLPLPPGLMG